ncbi:E2 domain-containing protein [Pelagibius sp. 7325]|uniref:E2 domain-containing protein n=1 Tax=Pelagibius sp. 7325 TaxID=3131994 RepID=UPI0030EBE660
MPDTISDSDIEDGQVTTLAALNLTRPNWVGLEAVQDDYLLVIAQPTSDSQRPCRSYKIQISLTSSGIVVAREAGTNFLPPSCPERHINADGSFCIGYNAGGGVVGPEAARRWWRKLEAHLLCQETAHREGTWPASSALSHGDAALLQLEAENLGEKLGMLDSVRAAVQGYGWIADHLWQVTDNGKSLLNKRKPCLCGYREKSGNTKLRRECLKDQDPCLMLLEAQRRDAEERYWEAMKKKPCCGTMKVCPLSKDRSPRKDRRAARRSSGNAKGR